MSGIVLTTRDRQVTTALGLVGNDENALTYALGYTFTQCPELLLAFLRKISIKGIWARTLNSAKIDLQRQSDDGITDIEIEIPGRAFVVVEAKIGLSVPGLAQCVKYLSRFRAHPKEPAQKLVALMATPAESVLKSYQSQNEELKGVLIGLSWASLIPQCISLLHVYPKNTPAGDCIRAFQRFMEKEYQMKGYTDEVWIVPANREPLWEGGLSFLDTHIKGKRIYYRTDYQRKRPLYIAFRYHGQVEAIQRVLSVEHDVCPIKIVPELSAVNAGWPSIPHTIWHLDEPVPLPKAIPTGNSKMRQRHVSCDIDILLSSPSIDEASKRMQQPRQVS